MNVSKDDLTFSSTELFKININVLPLTFRVIGTGGRTAKGTFGLAVWGQTSTETSEQGLEKVRSAGLMTAIALSALCEGGFDITFCQ